MINLDIFHAMQRAMPKRHPFFSQCVNDLKLFFRSPTDLGMDTTPHPAIILKNLETFQEKWVDCEFNEWKLVTAKTARQLASLKVHINTLHAMGPTGRTR